MMHDLKQRPVLRDRGMVMPIGLLILLLVLKLIYVYGLRIDSDETQHLHVVWA